MKSKIKLRQIEVESFITEVTNAHLIKSGLGQGFGNTGHDTDPTKTSSGVAESIIECQRTFNCVT